MNKTKLTKLALTAALVLATTLTLSCGNHSFEELLGLDSSSSEQEDNYSSSSLKLSSSSSSLRQSSSNSQKIGDDDEIGVEPPNDNVNISAPSPQGTVIVAPLLKTNWGRGSPYDPFHTLPDGSSGWIGCVTTAIAQILNYHKYPTQGIGDVYQGIIFDWDNMLDSYKNVNLTEQQRNAITALLNSLHLAYGSNSRGFVKNFGYDNDAQTLYRKYYDDSEWAAIFTAIIKKPLDLDLPVFCHGKNLTRTSGHGFILDGYDSRGKFHINWGWGSSYDGYYPIDSLTPGRTLENGFHNSDFHCTINIKPDAGGVGRYTLALDTFAIEKNISLGNEQVTVVAKINTQGTFPAGKVAIALVDSRGNIAAVVGATNFKKNLSTSFTPAEMVEPGKYSLSVVAKPDGKDWETITLSDHTKNVPKSINISVSEFHGTPGGGYGLTLRRFNIVEGKTTASPNEEFTVDHSLSDLSTTTFPRTTSGVALMDNDNNIVEILGTLEIPSNATSNMAVGKKIKCKIPSTVSPGQYKLRIAVKTEGKTEWRIVTQTDGNPPTFIDFAVL